MDATLTKSKQFTGGEFIVRDFHPDDIYIPEEISEEQKMVREMVTQFMKSEAGERSHQLDFQAELLEKAGETGLLGAHMPEIFGGMQLDSVTNAIIAEEIGKYGASFNTTWAAHTGIGMLPILYFGTDDQKRKYLPKLVSGEWKAAYCLTEPSSGSDALAAKTRADLNEEGTHYILNGQKMWISNAGFADIFIVFAKIDGTAFTGFIVEADTRGVKLGEEEKKLGIKGSSTRQVFFEQAAVPVENLLGEKGKGHLIAFNALNIGRFRLGNMAMGGCKRATSISIGYANERHQFGQPISAFGAIKYKLAQQAILTYVLESAVYRVADMLEKQKLMLIQEGKAPEMAGLETAEEFAIECTFIKVAGSEYIEYIIDEMLQIHGGYGYSEEYPAARAYRDARINRIYEGTNEINRLLIVNMLLKRAMKGRLDLVGPAWEVQKELAKMPSFTAVEGEFGAEKKALSDFKKLTLMVLGAAAKMQMDGKLDLKEEQEIVMNGANMLTDVFFAESLLLRLEKLHNSGRAEQVHKDILQTYFWDVNAKMTSEANNALVSFATGDLLKTFLLGVKRYTGYPPVNVKSARRRIADHLIKNGTYTL
jgi:alkylation response protein AidB-like acyl-CoA dehydrogenase